MKFIEKLNKALGWDLSEDATEMEIDAQFDTLQEIERSTKESDNTDIMNSLTEMVDNRITDIKGEMNALADIITEYEERINEMSNTINTQNNEIAELRKELGSEINNVKASITATIANNGNKIAFPKEEKKDGNVSGSFIDSWLN